MAVRPKALYTLNECNNTMSKQADLGVGVVVCSTNISLNVTNILKLIVFHSYLSVSVFSFFFSKTSPEFSLC